MNALRSRANIEKKRQKRKKVLLAVPVVVVVILILFFYYAFSARFHVKSILVNGASFIEKDQVEASVREMLEEKLWKFVPRKAPMLIGEKYMEQMLSEKYHPIKAVEVEVRDGLLTVNIVERTAVSVLCTMSASCYFLDEGGYAFVTAPQFEGSSFIKIKTYDDTVQTGSTVVQKEELDKIAQQIEFFKSVSISVQHVVLTSETEMRLVDSFNTEYIIMRQEPVENVEERLKAILISRPDITVGTYEYVDLRIDSKIFLKNKES